MSFRCFCRGRGIIEEEEGDEQKSQNKNFVYGGLMELSHWTTRFTDPGIDGRSAMLYRPRGKFF